MEIINSNPNKWDYSEIIFKANFNGNPFKEVELSATFTNGGHELTVLGFYDGNNEWKIRFMPTETGTWFFKTTSSLKELDNKDGSINCLEAKKDVHGVVNVVHETQFSYSDGTIYHPIGTTCYVWNLQDEVLEEKTLKTLKNSPFNKIRFCIYPKRYTFNYNEPKNYPFPGKVQEKWLPEYQDDYTPRPHHSWWDYDFFNHEYFKHIDESVLKLRDMGIEADLILFHPYDFGAWGFDCIPEDVNIRILKYLVARLGSFRNIWWSFANEYDLFQNKAIHEWDRYIKLVQSIDPYNHLRSIHNMADFFDHSKPWITHCSVQCERFDDIPEWFSTYKKPIVIDECGYEGNIDRDWGDLSGKEMVHRFWLGFSQGAYVGHGETYINPEENLWWAKGGEITGESPARIEFLAKIIKEIPTGYFKTLSFREAFISKGKGCGIFPEFGLYYLGDHQPSFKNINLPSTGKWQIDIIDTWDMTIKTLGVNFTNNCRIDLPGKDRIAIRITKK